MAKIETTHTGISTTLSKTINLTLYLETVEICPLSAVQTLLKCYLMLNLQ